MKEKFLKEFLEEVKDYRALSGSEDADKMAVCIQKYIEAAGAICEVYRFPIYVSNPLWSEWEIELDGEAMTLPSRPRSFCKHTLDWVEGEIFCDTKALEDEWQLEEKEKWYRQVKDKIVIGYNFYEDYVALLEKYGARGLIHIWSSEEDTLHEETVGPCWGTPLSDTHLPELPVIGIGGKEGKKLYERILIKTTNGQSVKGKMRTCMEEGVKEVTLPVATLGDTEGEFVLVGGHYDVWYEGLTDNKTGNALCLELVRYFKTIEKELKRGIKIAFWPGHSNGRYAGSTWYCDEMFEVLREGCVAYINIDSPGCREAVTAQFRGTGVDEGWLETVLGGYLPKEHIKPLKTLSRGGDFSFYGVDIPIQIMPLFGPVEGKYDCPGSGGGWWWHAKEDTYDKIDFELLLRDTHIVEEIVEYVTREEHLPIGLKSQLTLFKQRLEEIEGRLDLAFNIERIKESIEELLEIEEEIILQEKEKIKIGGVLNRLLYTDCETYSFDSTFPLKLIPGLSSFVGIEMKKLDEKARLGYLTAFRRTSNKYSTEIQDIIKNILDKRMIDFK